MKSTQEIELVENCSDDDWHKQCAGEEWTVGVITRHIGASHYGSLSWAKMIVDGQALPDIGFDVINQVNARHVRENADCSREEVLNLLREGGTSVTEYVSGLSDAELDRTSHLALAGGDISTQTFIENIIIGSAGQRSGSAKATVGA